MDLTITFTFDSGLKKEVLVKEPISINKIRDQIVQCNKRRKPFEYIIDADTKECMQIFLEHVAFIDYELA